MYIGTGTSLYWNCSFRHKKMFKVVYYSSRNWSITANEGPVRIQYKCLVPIYVFPEMKLHGLVRYFRTEVYIMFCFSIFTFMYLWLVFIYKYINRSQIHECTNREWGRAVSFLGIHKSDFPYSSVASFPSPRTYPFLHLSQTSFKWLDLAYFFFFYNVNPDFHRTETSKRGPISLKYPQEKTFF